MTDIDIHAASLVMASSNPLEALIELSQDFPKYSAALARKVQIPDNIQEKATKISMRGQAESTVIVNGKAVGGDDRNAFS